MIIDFQTRFDQRVLGSLSRARIRYKSEERVLVLFFEHHAEPSLSLPWLQGVTVHIVDERDQSTHQLDVQWIDIEGSLICAKASCPEYFESSDREFVPIDRITIKTIHCERSYENTQSARRMKGRS